MPHQIRLLEISDYVALYALFWFHWMIVYIFIFYIPLTRNVVAGWLTPAMQRGLDILFLVSIFGILFHWLILKYECVVSYLEKKIIYSNYNLGKDPLVNPSLFLGFNVNMSHPYVQLFVFALWSLIALNLAVALASLFPNHAKLATHVAAILYVIVVASFLITYKRFI